MARRKDRPAGPLDPREAAILRAVIEEYIRTAAPVGSQALVDRGRFGVSSATVRHVMADLEAAGYLRQPHTSAGRVPTDAGYRLYVESIAEQVSLAPVEQLMIRHQFGQVEFASEQWFRLAAATLAGATHAAGIATPAKPTASRIKRVHLFASGERLATLVLMLGGGQVKQSLVSLPAPASQEQLELAAQWLNERLVGRSARGADALARRLPRESDADAVAAAVTERVALLMRDYDGAAVEDLFSEGLLNVMEQPEFERSEKLRRVFGVLQDRAYLGRLVHQVARSGRVAIFIGSENEPAEMHDVSLVVAPYGRATGGMGLVGVLGPTRMAYPHAISSVRYVSGLMNELVEHLYS
jgi:heat-inducible transcriptional repressor